MLTVMAVRRKELDLTQSDLGKIVGTHQSIISMYENGQMAIGAEDRKRLSEALELDENILQMEYVEYVREREKQKG